MLPWAAMLAWAVVLPACERTSERGTGGAPSSQPAAASVAAQPLSCPKYPQLPAWGELGDTRLRITVRPPKEKRTVKLESNGVKLTFGFEAFLNAAQCLKQPQAVEYLHKRPASETVVVMTGAEEPQLFRVVAALLDRGEVAISEPGTKKRAAAIIKSHYTWMGCGGACRHLGREYRLRIPGKVFFQVTDRTAHGKRK
jgi:hypothetical protein